MTKPACQRRPLSLSCGRLSCRASRRALRSWRVTLQQHSLRHATQQQQHCATGTRYG